MLVHQFLIKRNAVWLDVKVHQFLSFLMPRGSRAENEYCGLVGVEEGVGLARTNVWPRDSETLKNVGTNWPRETLEKEYPVRVQRVSSRGMCSGDPR